MYGKKRVAAAAYRPSKKYKAASKRVISRRKALSKIRSFATPYFRLPSALSNSAVPAMLRTRLIYADNGYSLNPGLGTAAVQIFSGNGCWDVDISGVGHQPAGFDQLMVLYKDYTVLQSSIKATLYNAATVPLLFGISITDESSGANDCRKYIENGLTNWKQLGPAGDCDSSPIYMKMDIAKYNGVADVLDDDIYRGTSGSNPSDQTYFHVWLQAVNTGDDPAACRLTVEVQFEVIFRNPRLKDLS